MKILSASQIRETDAYTIIHNNISSTQLMENAAKACVQWIVENFPKNNKIIVFLKESVDSYSYYTDYQSIIIFILGNIV